MRLKKNKEFNRGYMIFYTHDSWYGYAQFKSDYFLHDTFYI
jgi:hypothetical protein